MVQLVDEVSADTRRLAPAHVDAPVAPAATPAVHRVWSVIRDSAMADALSEAFIARGIFHVHRQPHATVVQSIPDGGLHCLIVDEDSLDLLLELQHRSVAVGAQTQRPTFVALLSGLGTEDRLRALRAGADHVLALGSEAGALAARVQRILATRSEEPLRVLVVDDDRSQTRFCAGILRRMGIHAVCCNDSALALAEMGRGLPDILLVDLHMPDIDGLELTECCSRSRARRTSRCCSLPATTSLRPASMHSTQAETTSLASRYSRAI
jgi:DNA-binding response OmpR family regulator